MRISRLASARHLLLLIPGVLLFSSFRNDSTTLVLTAEAFALPHTICQSDAFGGAKVIAQGGEEPYSYLWDDGSTYALNLSLSAGLHSVTVTDALGAEVIAEVEVLAANQVSLLNLFTQDTFLCKGEFGFMEITNAYVEQAFWSNGDTTLEVIVAPDGDSTFYATADVLGDNYLLNGAFEYGDALFFTDYNLGLGGAFGLLSLPGTYRITDDLSSVHNNFPSCGDHSSGAGLMLVVNGSEQSGQKVWCETVPVEIGQDYYFSGWVMLASQTVPPQLQLMVNDEVVSETFIASDEQCEWKEMKVLWPNISTAEATICLTNLNTAGPGNDFALDDFYFGPICSATDSLSFELSDLEAEATITLFPDCLDTTGAAVVLPTGGTMPYTYLWDSGELNADASGLKPGVHRITVTDADGCKALVGFIMPEPEYLTLDSLIPRPTSCGEANGLIRILPDEGTAPFLYSIDGGDSFQQEQLFPDLAAGTYAVIVEDAEGCTYETQATIADSESFSIEIQSALGTTICEEPELRLEVPGSFTRYRWSTNDTTMTLTVSEPGIYGVVVVDADRCEAVDTIEITVCNDYQVPNVFTPNGDDINDLFGPVSRDAVRIIYLQVVNRWGEVVYFGQDPWDGTHKGEPHPTDVFAYRMLLRDRDNQIMLEQGEVTLLR